MALQAGRHLWHVGCARLLTCRKVAVAVFALGSGGNMFLMVEQNWTFWIGQFFRFVGITMTLTAGFIILDIVA